MGQHESGTVTDPFDGSTQELFDAIMEAAQTSTLIHLSAGTFFTRGIVLKDGFHLVGRGKEPTTLKFMNGAENRQDELEPRYFLFPVGSHRQIKND
jgi:hypothetical protein